MKEIEGYRIVDGTCFDCIFHGKGDCNCQQDNNCKLWAAYKKIRVKPKAKPKAKQDLDSSNFDERKFYDREIAPLVSKLYDKCESRNLPLLCAVATSKNNVYANIFIKRTRTPRHFKKACDIIWEQIK